MSDAQISPLSRFLHTLQIVRREGRQLLWSRSRLFGTSIDEAWVHALDTNPEQAETLEAFVSRYGRMQDTIADKPLPRWLAALAERPGSQIETLNRAERLGVIEDTTTWLEARQLRNRLIHEYMTDAAGFAIDIRLAREYSLLLIETYNRLRLDVMSRLGLQPEQLPEALDAPDMEPTK